MINNRPIGVFDSGLGGLTVLKYLLKKLPSHNFIYLGDLANLPYGNKSQDRIIDYSIKCSKFLQSKNVSSIIVACNTASSLAFQEIQKHIPNIPIFNVIDPCVDRVVQSDSKKIGVLGTEKTIASNIYAQLINQINKNIHIYNKACPLFVPIVEEGLEDSAIARHTIKHYLYDMKAEKVDKIILGCTHYPILLKSLNNFFNNNIEILHSGPIIADKLFNLTTNQQGQPAKKQEVQYYVTDLPARFSRYGNKFLDDKIGDVQLININQ